MWTKTASAKTGRTIGANGATNAASGASATTGAAVATAAGSVGANGTASANGTNGTATAAISTIAAIVAAVGAALCLVLGASSAQTATFAAAADSDAAAADSGAAAAAEALDFGATATSSGFVALAAADSGAVAATSSSSSTAAAAASSSADAQSAADSNLAAISPRNVSYTTEAAFIGTLGREANYEAQLDFPRTVSVLIPRNANFVSASCKNGEFIEKGDPIATFSVNRNELAIDEAELALELAQDQRRREISALSDVLESARSQLAAARTGGAQEPAARLAELAVERAEENLDFAQYSSERDIAAMQKNLENLRVASADFTIKAPIGGYVYNMQFFPVGGNASQSQVLCSISDPGLFQLTVTNGDLNHLKLGADVTIETSKRDAPTFKGHVIGNTTLLGDNGVAARAVVAFSAPEDFIAFADNSASMIVALRYRVRINLSDIRNVLLVPRRAINAEATYRFVNVLEGGLPKKRYVLTGLSNIEYVQILDGVKAGDEIIVS